MTVFSPLAGITGQPTQGGGGGGGGGMEEDEKVEEEEKKEEEKEREEEEEKRKLIRGAMTLTALWTIRVIALNDQQKMAC